MGQFGLDRGGAKLLAFWPISAALIHLTSFGLRKPRTQPSGYGKAFTRRRLSRRARKARGPRCPRHREGLPHHPFDPAEPTNTPARKAARLEGGRAAHRAHAARGVHDPSSRSPSRGPCVRRSGSRRPLGRTDVMFRLVGELRARLKPGEEAAAARRFVEQGEQPGKQPPRLRA